MYRARDLKEDKIVAIKKIKLDRNEEGIPATTLREVSLLQHLKHPNIVEMSGVLYDNNELSLVFEFMDSDLKGYLDKLDDDIYPNATIIKRFTYELTEGIRHCHCRRILHRDLKPQNLLVSDEPKLTLKIADFGLGREHHIPIDELTHEVVTLWYRPPEILLGRKRYSGAADIWGIGCIVAEMATKLPLFAGDSEIDQLFQIYRILGTPNPEIWPGIDELPDYSTLGPQWKKKDLAKELEYRLDADGIDLLEKTLIYPPNERITAQKMLLHRWFDDIREEMKDIFGNEFPHCGSEEYQRNLHRRNRERAKKENNKEKEHDAECVVDQENQVIDTEAIEDNIEDRKDTEQVEVDEFENADLDQEQAEHSDSESEDDDMRQRANKRDTTSNELSQPMDQDQ